MSNGVRCRCRKCRARRTLKRHPLEYKIPPPCRSCGATEAQLRKQYGDNTPPRLIGKSLLWLVEHRETELKNRRLCYADCFPRGYPHRWGSPGCKHRVDFLIDASLRGTDRGEAAQGEPCGF